MSLPTRAAEPWSVESWFVQIQASIRQTLFLQGPQVYATTPSMPSGGHRAGYSPYGGLIDSKNGFISAATQIQIPQVQMCSYVMIAMCPRSIYSPANTSWNTTIEGNDVCRQLTVWPPKQQWPAVRDTGERVPGQHQGQEWCPSWHGRNLDSFYPDLLPRAPLEVRQMRACSKGTVDLRQRGNLIASARTSRWHQSLMTVYPPGTVAVLPITPGTPIVGDSPDYQWRVNRAHVVALTVDVPASSIVDTNESAQGDPVSTSARVDAQCTTNFPVEHGKPSGRSVAGIRVLLDDPWCVHGRNCTPDVGMASWNSTPSLSQVLEQYSRTDAVSGLFPRARMGCAVAYDVNHASWNVDLMPSDLPASQNSWAFTVGGLQRPYRQSGSPHLPMVVANRGRYPTPPGTPSNKSSFYDNGIGTSLSLGADIVDSAPDKGIPSIQPGLAGPLAVYRGAVPSRIFPLHPDSSLPRIQGGSWACHRSSLLGNFAGRPVCMAMCDDPSKLPVDVGLEQSDGAWEQVASVVRVWYGEWLGHPVLRQSDELLQLDRLARAPAVAPLDPTSSGQGTGPTYVDGGSPQIECRSDLEGLSNFGMGYNSVPAARSLSGHANLRFDLFFDRNNWPPAVTQTWLFGSSPPGVDFPHPVQRQLAWVLEDLKDDLRDLAGDTGDNRAWQSAVLFVNATPPSSDYINLTIPSMLLRIGVQVQVRPLVISIDTNSRKVQILTQRARSAGAVVQRLAATLRGQRPGSEGGTWLLAVDPESVSYSVQLPCLKAMGKARAEHCEEDWANFFSRSEQVVQLALAALTVVFAISTLAFLLVFNDTTGASQLVNAKQMRRPSVIQGDMLRPIHPNRTELAGRLATVRRMSTGSDMSDRLEDNGMASWAPLWHSVVNSIAAALGFSWPWMLVVTLVYAECSLPALVLGLGLVIMCVVRLGMMLGCGLDLLGAATEAERARSLQGASVVPEDETWSGVGETGNGLLQCCSGDQSLYARGCISPVADCCTSCLGCDCAWLQVGSPAPVIEDAQGGSSADAWTSVSGYEPRKLRRSGRRTDGTEDAWAPPVLEHAPRHGPTTSTGGAARKSHSQLISGKPYKDDAVQTQQPPALPTTGHKLQMTAVRLSQGQPTTDRPLKAGYGGRWKERGSGAAPNTSLTASDMPQDSSVPSLDDPAASLDNSISSIQPSHDIRASEDAQESGGLLSPFAARQSTAATAGAEMVAMIEGKQAQDSTDGRANSIDSLQQGSSEAPEREETRLRASASSEDRAIAGLARMQALQPALFSAIRGLSVLAWEAQAAAAWMAYRDDAQAARHVSRRPLLQDHAGDNGDGQGEGPRKSPHELAWRALQHRLAVVRRHAWWLRAMEDVLVVGVLVWVVLCVLGVCGWQECSLAAARLAAGGDDAQLLRSVLQESEDSAVYGLEPVLVGLQRLQLLSVSVPMVMLSRVFGVATYCYVCLANNSAN